MPVSDEYMSPSERDRTPTRSNRAIPPEARRRRRRKGPAALKLVRSMDPPGRSARISSPVVQALGLLAAAAAALQLLLLASPALGQPSDYFQPTLIGYRFEGPQEYTPDGISIIEANSPIKLTLFGELFTTDTIVGFTTEFAQDVELEELPATTTTTTTNSDDATAGADFVPVRLSRQISRELRPELLDQPLNSSSESNKSSSSKQLVESANKLRLATSRQTEANIRERRFRRRLLDKRTYDCTDYDRVISYKLTEANLITPNVAVLTVKLPELELSSSSLGMFYYFCLKQPANFERPPAVEDNGALGAWNPQAPPSSSSSSSLGVANSSASLLVWVHQGDEWWLTIKVEPPMLSIANDCVLIVALLFLSAVTSGLNLGLMSLDMNELAVISSCGDPRERSYARTIAPLRKRGNYLLCSLLLGNVMVNSTLTVILEEMTSGVVAVIGSTLAIVVLGEIVPQAFCARQGLAIGAKTIYLTYAFMLITFPLSYPIACLLDCVLGEEKGNVYDRERLMEFIRITGNHTQLEPDEVAIISGALKLKKIKVDQIMTKIEDVFMLPIDCMLDRKTIRSIIEKGYSRIPIYESNDRKQIVALILAKDLALLDPDDQMPLASMLRYCKHPLVFVEDTVTLDVALNEFKTGKSHMAIVRQLFDDGEVDKYYEAIGVVTLEDVIEEVLQTEINDETDTLSDNRRKRRRTEAQVAHLVDELITTTTASAAVAAAAAGAAMQPSTKF